MKRLSAKKIFVLILCIAMLLSLIPDSISFAAQQLVVDLSVNTGEIKYGASGFLYGMGSEGVPTDNVLQPLNPHTAAQKAPDGLQHPNGDALKIAPQFVRNGGKYIQIYMQDIYQNWPYENLGINDYLDKVDSIVRKVVADPYRDSYVYVPFNEPDGIWYGSNITALCNDWKLVYDKIRSIDPTGKIAGINYAAYNNSHYTTFMSFAKNNNCLPDIITWHELQNNFFTDWYTHVSNYRAIETGLGISPRPICINEYARSSGDLGVPGNLVQWMTRLENSKVEGCLAYWTIAGSLNDLVTQNNKATGGWWLYKWYGELTGNTVQVTPPTQNGSLQGLAAHDSAKKQARIIFGGSPNSTDVFSTDVVVKGFPSYFGNSVRVTLWEIDNTGTNPSNGPVFKQEGDYTISNGQILVPVTNMKALSAYQMIVTPNVDLSSANVSNRYEAEYAKITGTANITSYESGYSGTGYSQGYGSTNNASTNFVVTAANDGYFDVTLRYSAGSYSGAPASRNLRMVINGGLYTDVTCNQTANWSAWANVTTRVFLQAGINRLDFKAFTADESDCVNIDYIDVTPASGTITNYEAEASGNTLSGTAVRENDSAASGGQYVGWLGNGSANTLQFNNVNVPAAGTYRMLVQFANAEKIGQHSYNNNIVDRYATVTVNGGTEKGYYFYNTLEWNTYRTTVIDVTLNAGDNTIKFGSTNGYAPNIDKISIAAPVTSGGASGSGIVSGATYKLVNRNSGKMLDVSGGSTADGGNVIQWTDNGGNNQKWIVTDTGSGYKLINVNSGKALDVYGKSTADGGNVVQWTYNGGNNQIWNIVNLANGYYKLINVNSGKVLDVNNSSTADGGDVIQWTDNGGNNQMWQFVQN